jgi:hypothetical protein
MPAYQVTMLGLVLDIIGGFLVAVEAIELKNLRILRERVFRTAYRYTLSPRIRVIPAAVKPRKRKDDDRPAERFVGVFMGLHYLAGFLVLVVVNGLVGGRLLDWAVHGVLWLLQRPWYIGWPVLVIGSLYLIVGGLWMLGELVHVLATKTTTFAIHVLEVIEVRTADGAVGIIGFAFLFAGFALQMCGTYLGRMR